MCSCIQYHSNHSVVTQDEPSTLYNYLYPADMQVLRDVGRLVTLSGQIVQDLNCEKMKQAHYSYQRNQDSNLVRQTSSLST